MKLPPTSQSLDPRINLRRRSQKYPKSMIGKKEKIKIYELNNNQNPTTKESIFFKV
jgi:hypothetical protein